MTQNGYYDPFDTVVLCVDAEYATTFLPPPDTKDVVTFDPETLYTSFDSVIRQVDDVVQRLHVNDRVVSVCTTGMNRSSAFSVLLLYRMGFPIERAVERIQELRHGPEGAQELIKLVKDYEDNRKS